MYIKRDFAAPRKLVWTAWTEPDILDKWWAPKPWKSKTKYMDFTEGGRRLYAMVSPDGVENWSFADFISITHKTNFRYWDGFCDSKGKINQNMPQSEWSIDFTESNDFTTVAIEISYESLSDMETKLKMGRKEGLTTTLACIIHEHIVVRAQKTKRMGAPRQF